jgi:hypothetical protein
MSDNDNQPATKNEVREIVMDASEAILKGIERILESYPSRDEMAARLDRIESRLDRVDTTLSHVRDEIKGLKADLSVTIRRPEFEELKERVGHYHSTYHHDS